ITFVKDVDLGAGNDFTDLVVGLTAERTLHPTLGLCAAPHCLSFSCIPPHFSYVTIAVGPPVTQRPPHRSRRAVFPHRALQQYSLPQVGLSLEGCLPRLGSSNDPWSGNFEALQDCCVALPRVTVALATPVKPLQQNPYGA